MKKLLMAILFCICAPCFLFADTLVLKNGNHVEGAIVEKNDDAVRIEVEGVTVTYFLSDIERINSQEIAPLISGEAETEIPMQEENTAIEMPSVASEEPEFYQEEYSAAEPAPTAHRQFRDSMAQATNAMSSPDTFARAMRQPGGFSKLAALQNPNVALAVMGVIFLLTIIMYLYTCGCLWIIARKTNRQPAWLAWIPIANLFLLCKIAGLSYLWLLVIFATIIPIIGPFTGIAFNAFIWYKVALARSKPGWIGILVGFPLIGFIFMGLLAFSE